MKHLRALWGFSAHSLTKFTQINHFLLSKTQSLSPQCSWHSWTDTHGESTSLCLFCSLLTLISGKKFALADRSQNNLFQSGKAWHYVFLSLLLANTKALEKSLLMDLNKFLNLLYCISPRLLIFSGSDLHSHSRKLGQSDVGLEGEKTLSACYLNHK